MFYILVKKGSYREILFKGVVSARATGKATPSDEAGAEKEEADTTGEYSPVNGTAFKKGCWCAKCATTHISNFACPLRTGAK